MIKTNYYVSSFFWSIIAKVFNSVIQFISVPLLLKYFGKVNYGIISLAIATNIYMNFLDLGLSIGAVKYYAQWKARGELGLIERVSRTSISFYSFIGFINSIILLLIAFYGHNLFQLTHSQFKIFQSLLILAAFFSIINWLSSVFTQLLIADERIAYVKIIMLVKSILILLAVVLTVYLKLSINLYFVLFLLSSSFILVPYYIKCKKEKLISTFLPQIYWKEFNIVLMYSLAIFAMGLFQFIAIQSRPIILGIFATKGVEIITEYRIVEVFPSFIISLGGILISIFLPRAAKFVSQNQLDKVQRLAYQGTSYSTILVAILCFPIMIAAKEIITVYVGVSYNHLYIWLVIWAGILILNLHNSPVSSIVLATGKTKMLIFSTAISCLVSIIVNASLTNIYGIGSAVIGYTVYVIIQMSFYYLYFNNKVLKLNSWKIFKSFIIPSVIGIVIFFVIQLLNIHFNNQIIQGAFKAILWLILYLATLLVLKVFDYKTLILLVKNK